jgi:hypothetical protein
MTKLLLFSAFSVLELLTRNHIPVIPHALLSHVTIFCFQY